MIIFDIITGELKYVNPIVNTSLNGVIDFGYRSIFDMAIDSGYRTEGNSIIDFELRV